MYMRNGVENKHNYANDLLPITTNHNIGSTAFADVHLTNILPHDPLN